MNKIFHTLLLLMMVSSNASASPARLSEVSEADTELRPISQFSQRGFFPKTLSGLYGIQSFQAQNLKQPIADFDLLYQRAQNGQQELEILTAQIALLTNTKTHSSGIKSKQRAQYKVDAKLSGEADQITDLVRSSIVANDIQSLMKVYELVSRESDVVRVKNRFKKPTPSGYRDLSLLVRLPKSQMIAEVQLHLADFSTIKNGAEHDNYEQIQQIERLKTIEDRSLTEFELARIKKLRSNSHLLYQSVWDNYLTPKAAIS